MTETQLEWQRHRLERLEAHLKQLVRALDVAGETKAADRFRRLTFEPVANFATGSEWLLEVALVADVVLNRFLPAAPHDAAVREAKRLAQQALDGP